MSAPERSAARDPSPGAGASGSSVRRSGGLKLGVFAIASHDWIAGGRHLVNLLAAIRAAGHRSVETFLVNPDENLLAALEEVDAAASGTLTYRLPRRRTPRSVLDSMARRVLATDPTADRLLAGAGIQVVFGALLQYRFRRMRTVSWVPDVQHVHLPEHFTREDRKRRSAALRRCLAVSDRVVVTSAAVRDDIARLAPRHGEKCVVAHPASVFPPSVYEADPHEVVATYRLPEKFFYLPNHFWTHKNHAAVRDAVRVLAERGERVVVVMTGIASDYRSPSYASDFLKSVAEHGLDDRMLYLGVVPRRDVGLLMRQSLAVLNPSLFEGWGYSVGEATALGKPVVVSDIPVHREQNPPGATFAPPLDAEALARALRTAWRELPLGQDRQRAVQARDDAERQLREYGQRVLDLFSALAR